MLKYAVLAMTFGSGLILIGYEDQARMKGWPVGELLSGDASFMKLPAFGCILSSVAISFFAFQWWSLFVTIGLGFTYGFLASQIMKSWVQFPAILGAISGFILCPLWVL